jgi:hypothetical protein
MTSTRNKNSLGDYEFQQIAIQKQAEYTTFINGPQGKVEYNHFAGDGLLSGRIAPMSLSHNACDIESFLYGIGSVNLVTPTEPIVPHLKRLHSLNIINRLPTIIPEPLQHDSNQRYLSS